MNQTNYKTSYYTKEMELSGFAPFPHYLLKLELSMTARVLYAQLLNRAKLSLQNGWVDERGRVYVYFSEAEIGQTLGKGRSAVQQALHDLDEADLITRERYAGRMGRRIYLKVIQAETEEDRKPASTILENRTSLDREIGPGSNGKPAPRNNTEKQESRNHTEKAKGYGCYGNVILSDEQLHALREAYPDDLGRYIEELSVYLKANGKTYHDYEAGIRKWAANDRRKNAVSQPERDYSYDGEDSL
ncbi:MAG: replication initiator protein A [Oscillospiraceae bacterium]|nr:replication initiator protein A [Oscillospiraceae bacterium]